MLVNKAGRRQKVTKNWGGKAYPMVEIHLFGRHHFAKGCEFFFEMRLGRLVILAENET